MREYFDPIYYQSSVRGTEYGGDTPVVPRQVKKSHSVVGTSSSSSGGRGSVSSNVLGRFLKLGKSKSDAQGGVSKSRSSYHIDDLEEDFRLSPSVLNRGPVEKMVHKSNNRKDISRSHSWIYGSVKLPSDLPFGYGYANGFGSGSSPSGSDSNSNGSGSPSNGHHTHGLATLQIPRCQMVDYRCSCECTGDFDFLTAGPGDGSSPPNNIGPCKACVYDWALGGKKNRKQASRNSANSSIDTGKTFVNSVRKLTWKSLKQAVKKRPSLDNLKRPEPLRVGVGSLGNTTVPFVSSEPPMLDVFSNPNGFHAGIEFNGPIPMANGYCNYSQNVFSPEDIPTNYFFPEKKNIHSSCTDIFRDQIPHATASVRVRPKPSRQSWQFTNESGPVPNYQEENVYHSEWDLRQCIPYDVWVNTTTHVKPRTTMPPQKSKTPTPTSEMTQSRNSSLSKSTSVPYLTDIKGFSDATNTTKADKLKAEINGKPLKVKSCSSGTVNQSDKLSRQSSSVGSSNKNSSSDSLRQTTANGVNKRPSILSADVNAYQLLKAQTRNADKSSHRARTPVDVLNDDALSSSSDDLSDNALTSDNHMRIAGQKIYMAPNLKGNQSSSKSNTNANTNGITKINGVLNKNQSKRSKGRPERISSEDEWSDGISSSHNKHVSISREENPHHNSDKGNQALNGASKELGNHRNNDQIVKSQQHQKSGDAIGVSRHANSNNGDYDNYRENNTNGSSANMIENGNLAPLSQTPITNPSVQNYKNHDIQSQTQRDYDEENYNVEFEEYVFVDGRNIQTNVLNDGMNNMSCLNNNPNTSTETGMSSFKTEFTSSTSSSNKSTLRNPLAKSNSSTSSFDENTARTRNFVKNGHNSTNKQSVTSTTTTNVSTESKPTSSSVNVGNNSSNIKISGSNCSNSSNKSNGKFGALRRRKSRNGSNNPGKLLREVIYEEEVEHEQTTIGEEDLISSHDEANAPLKTSASQRTNKSSEYAVKIVVSHSTGTTDYVKPILKNRERIYDAPINYNGSTNDGYNSNDIYFDSSVSTSSTLKKKVQFDQRKVIVCGGDSGPDSDDYAINEDDIQNKRSIKNHDSNFSRSSNNNNDNGIANDCDDDEDVNSLYANECSSKYINSSSRKNYYHQSTKESGSVSFKSNSSRKSALTDNDDNSCQNQSSEITKKTRSTFEEEVARKAASFAISRQRQVDAAAANVCNSNGNNLVEDDSSSFNVQCFDGSGSVNNLRPNEDYESRFTGIPVNNPVVASSNSSNTTSNVAERKSINSKSSDIRNSQGTGSIAHSARNPEPTQQQQSNGNITKGITNANSTNNTGSKANKERHFTKNSNNKASHGVTSSILKAKRIANSSLGEKSTVNVGHSQQGKILNPNSLLFNDTTRIRLNQSRPSLNEAFKLNLSQNGQGNRYGSEGAGPKNIRLKQSSSFRSVGSTPLRPKEPPPPPPVAMRNGSQSQVKNSARLQQMNLSSSLSGQIDKLLTKSSSSSTIYGSANSLNGNRMLTKSEISLPMSVQTTSNQASSAIKNQSTRGQKDNSIISINCSSSNNNQSNKSFSGLETLNGAKSSGSINNASRIKQNVDCKKMDASNGNKSKSLTDKCQALDKALGQQFTTKSNANNAITRNGGMAKNNNRNSKQEEIATKLPPQTRGILKKNASVNEQKLIKTGNNSQNILIKKSSPQTNINSQNNIEIVTKENSVSEIRIYSSSCIEPTALATPQIIKSSEEYCSQQTYDEVNNAIVAKSLNTNEGDVNYKQEIHYAATDILPLNEPSKKFRQPAPLPPIPKETVVSVSRPQSTSVVLIVDNRDNCIKGIETIEPSSPLTYSQPIDSLSKSSTKTLSSVDANFNSSTLTSKSKDDDDEIIYDEGSEPLYDDVINHSRSTTNKTTNHGSVGKRFLISSLNSMKQSARKPLSNLQEKSNNCQTLPSHQQNHTAQVVSSTLPCLACPPSLPPPNLPSKNLSEFHNRPVVLDEDEGDRGTYCDQQSIDDEVDNLYNDISDGASNTGKSQSLQSFASSMKGALMHALKNMDFDRRSVISNSSNHSAGSSKSANGKYDFGKSSSDICNIDNFIYDDTLSLRSHNSEEDASRSYYKTNVATTRLKSQFPPPPPSSVRSGTSVSKPLDNLMEQDESLMDDEPLYDDVINFPHSQTSALKNKKLDTSNSSDSGAESEDAIPPPLPAQGPPKISTELPLLTFPLLLNKSNRIDSHERSSSIAPIKEKVIDILVDPSKSHQNNLHSNQINSNAKPTNETSSTTTISSENNQEDVLIRTRSLLHELNEKLTQLNSLSTSSSNLCSGSNNNNKGPLEFSTYSPNKVVISSSSESSGVEEDYNSEKNYSLSNSSDAASASSSSAAEENYKLAQVTKLVTETITMARGKFLDSMKSANSSANAVAMLSSNRTSPISNRDCESSPGISEEPIYEEIGDINRSSSPIYADAFDAKSIFDGASRDEILSFLESIRDRLTASDSNSSGSQSSSISSQKCHESEKQDILGETESAILTGVINHFSTNIEQSSLEDNHVNKLVLRKLCPDCNDVALDVGDVHEIDLIEDKISTNLCGSCNRKRNERKEIIAEIHETEMKYGRDLKIISEEFYKPIQIAGLLTKEQLEQIFLNVVELMEISAQLTSMLKAEIAAACIERSDEDLTSVNVGKIFLEIGETMMTAFQTYCTRQATAGALLAQLEKEKELLRIFLRVSQMENTVLRRMNLPAFLMVPVQRVTRYPLLLSRLLKVTPIDHFSRDELRSAHEKIEQHLEHMNKATREVASVKLWRRISIINGNSTPIPRRSNSDLEGATVSIRKMAIDVLDWTSLNDITCIMDNQLGVFHFNGKPLRGIYGCLIARGKDLDSLALKMDQEMFFPPSEDLVKEVKLVLVRVKNTRFCLLREPLCLSKCVISQGENEFQEFVEINEITTKNTYYLQGIDRQATANWQKFMQCYSMCVGQWRRRRGALANIMMNGMLKHL